jgi:GNAT superfamily N-acetyltransferase
MIRNPSEKSLVEILQERPDICFDGWKIDDESKVERYKDRDWMKVYRDGHGNYYQTDNDYIQTREKDGQRVAILIADESDENIGVSHQNPDLPHLIGLYVREPYRSEGLATELVHEFMRRSTTTGASSIAPTA